MNLKQTIAISFMILLLCTGIMADVCGQTIVAVGHISAEVIESVHTSSAIVTGFDLKNDQIKTGSIQNNKSDWDSETVNLGAVTINSGESIVCNIKLCETTLSDNHGNSFTINTTTTTSGRPDTLRADGSQIIQLNCTAHLTHGLASGKYQGSYTLDVLYN